MGGLSAVAVAVAPAFEVEFIDVVDGHRRGPLRELWSARFEHAVPVRSLPSFNGQRNFTGLYYAATMDVHVGFESWLERPIDRTNRGWGSSAFPPGCRGR
jgi:hypothetical protein